jgi:hypothetical protein
MSRLKRRIKTYCIVFLVLLVVAVFLPAILKVISDYFHSEQAYYYPHDLQRDEYLNEQKKK